MSKHVHVDLPNEILWPRKCASCGSTNEKALSSFNTYDSKKTVIPIPIPFVGSAWYSRTIGVDVSYPICQRCTDKTEKSEFTSKKLGKACGIALCVTFLVLLGSIDGQLPKKLQALAWFLIGIEAMLMVYCALAADKVPVRIHNLTKNSVALVFANDRYANEFEKLNRPYARHVSRAKSLIGLKG